MSDTENLADLIITFAAVDTPALAAFARMSAAAEEMVAAVTGAVAETNAAMAGLSAGADAAAAGVTTAMGEAGVPMERLGAQAQQTAASVAEANARMAQVEREWAAATNQAAAEVAAANERQAASFAALKDKVEADMAGLAAAEEKAAKANAAITDAKNGAGLGILAASAAKAKASYGDFAGKIGMTGKQLALLGTAAAVVAVGTSKMAGDFESETQRLVSSAGEVESNLKMVRQGILGISSATGYSLEELSTGMYKVESGGQHGAAGLKVLQAAAEGARAENADMATVADAVTSALTDYHLKAEDAATVTSKLVAATASGKMTFEELARSLASVLPVASANHVSLNDILGDMASMTTHGMTAQRTTQNLADAIRHMAAPTKQQRQEFALLRTNAQQVSNSLGTKGLSGTIQDLATRIQQRMGPQATSVILKLGDALKGLDPKVQALGQQLMSGSIDMGTYAKKAAQLPPILAGQASEFATLAKSTHSIGNAQMSGKQVMQTYSGALRQAMGDATGMNVALMLTGENSKTTAGAIKAVSGATTEAGNHVRGWAGIQGTFNQKVKEAKASFKALATEVGMVFLPVVSKLVGGLAKAAGFLAKHKSLAIALAIVVGGVLTLAFAAAAVAAWSFTAALLANPIVWIVAGIMLAVAALVLLVVVIVKHWGPISAFFKKLWHSVLDAFKAAGKGIKTAWNAVLKWFEGIGKAIAKPFVKAWDEVKKVFEMSPKEIGEKIGFALGSALKHIIKFGKDMVLEFVAAFKQTVKAAKTFGKDVVAGMKVVLEWLKDLPGNINRLFGEANEWLIKAGKDLWEGFLKSLKSAWNGLWKWLSEAPTRIKDLFKDAGHWLADTGKDLWNGLVNGLKNAWHTVTSAISGFVKGFISGFKKGLGISSPSTIFMQIGRDILTGLLNGLNAVWNTVNSWFGGIPNKILGFYRSAGSWLVSAGKAILNGLLNGLKSVWGGVQSFVGGIGDWIKNHKGPIEVDRVLLVPHGKAIMDGLHKGMVQQNSVVQAFVQSVPGQITAGLHSAASGAHAAGQSYAASLAAGIRSSQHLAIAAAQDMANSMNGIHGKAGAPLAVNIGGAYSGYQYAGALAGPGPSGGGGDTHLHVNVQGSVWTTRDLVTDLQTELSRIGMRNTTNGTNYLGFNRGTTASLGR